MPNRGQEFHSAHPKGTKYFEGTLQLRNPSQEVVDFVWAEVDKNVGKHVYIQKSVASKNGLDYYLTSNRFLRSLGNDLQNKFGGELKLSAKLFSVDKQSSKELHRLTVLFRLPDFCVGQNVEYKGEQYRVFRMNKKVFLKNDKSGKKVLVSQREMGSIRKCE
ncbi:MAG: NMD3-related protein [Nanoarchaeota archaeon]|nr:NMD3-related protein [Nanoarchaeota archaeon]